MFDANGYRQAARKARIPEDVIAKTIEEQTGLSGWLTGGREGFRGGLETAGNILNLPSYAIGGMLNKAQEAAGSQYGSPTEGLGIVEGIKRKQAVMNELPESLGIDPESGKGLLTGFAGEMLTPTPIGKAKAGYNLLRGVKDSGKFGKAAQLTQKLGLKLNQAGKDLIAKGIGSPALIRQIEKMSGMPIDEFITKYGDDLLSRSPESAKALKTKLLSQFDELGAQSSSMARKQDVIGEFNKAINEAVEISKREKSPEINALIDELILRRERVNNIQGNLIPISELTQAKRDVVKITPQTKIGLGGSDLSKAGARETARDIYMKAAQSVEPKLKQLGKDIRAMGGNQQGKRGLIDLYETAKPRRVAKMPLGLFKTTTTGAGGIIGGIPGAIAGYAVGAAAENPKVIQNVSQFAKKAGEKLQTPKAMELAQKASNFGKNLFTTAFRTQSIPEPEGIFNKNKRRK